MAKNIQPFELPPTERCRIIRRLPQGQIISSIMKTPATVEELIVALNHRFVDLKGKLLIEPVNLTAEGKFPHEQFVSVHYTGTKH